MKLEQAARQALEALEIYGEHAKDCPQYPTYTRPQDYPKCDCGYEEAITALREALEQLNCQCGDKCFPIFSGDIEYCETCGKPTALAEPVRKCDGLLCNDCGEYKQRYKDLPGLTEKDLCVCSLAEQAEQEPFKMICPRCKVDRVTTQCPNRGGIGDWPMTATAQSAAPVKSICYQEAYDALEAQLIKEPTGNGLDQVAQNNGLIIAMNTLQKMNLAEQAERVTKGNGSEVSLETEAQEPVAYLRMGSDQRFVVTKAAEELVADTFHQLYAAPVRTKDLTDDEIYKLADDVDWAAGAYLGFARAVIAADREKNK